MVISQPSQAISSGLISGLKALPSVSSGDITLNPKTGLTPKNGYIYIYIHILINHNTNHNTNHNIDDVLWIFTMDVYHEYPSYMTAKAHVFSMDITPLKDDQ